MSAYYRHSPAFQEGAYQVGAFQLGSPAYVAPLAFQPCAFQDGAFQTDGCKQHGAGVDTGIPLARLQQDDEAILRVIMKFVTRNEYGNPL